MNILYPDHTAGYINLYMLLKCIALYTKKKSILQYDNLKNKINSNYFLFLSEINIGKWEGGRKAMYLIFKSFSGISVVVQWLRLCTPNSGGLGSTPGQGTRSHMHAATKSSHAATKDPAGLN